MANSNPPLVSIGIPTYNRADCFLKQALQSAVNQTYGNIEIIVSDNCSTDHTEDLVNEFSDSRIKYIKHNNNIGANNNFNFCVNRAKGDYFLLLHDDDLIDPDLVETCMDVVNNDIHIGVVFTGSRVIDEDGKILSENPNRVKGLSTADFFLNWFSGNIALYLCSTLFNTKRLKEIGGFKSRTNHFQDVVAEVLLAAKYGSANVYGVKASFRRHSSNMGGAVSEIEPWCQDCLYLLDIMCELAPESEARIRREGMPYFCRKNYRLASTIESPIERLKVYLLIYRTFDYCYSPFSYFRNKRFLMARIKGQIKRTLMG